MESARWVCSRQSTSLSSSSGSSVASRLRSSTARASTRAHRVEDLLVLVVGGTAALDQVPPQPRADVALDLAHHRVDADLRVGHPRSLRRKRQQHVAGHPLPQRVARVGDEQPVGDRPGRPRRSIRPSPGTWFTVSYSRAVLKSQMMLPSVVEYARMWPSTDPGEHDAGNHRHRRRLRAGAAAAACCIRASAPACSRSSRRSPASARTARRLRSARRARPTPGCRRPVRRPPIPTRCRRARRPCRP